MKSSDFFEKAKAGSPDRFMVNRLVKFKWKNPPDWVFENLSRSVGFEDGSIGFLSPFEDRPKTLSITVKPGFCFDVSVAPSFRRAMAAACLHDWLYSHADALALFASTTKRHILHCADHWFLAQMSASGFLLARTYFIAVRIFGYWFTTLTN